MESHLESNKFYVPSVEEFHIGFEIEWLHHTDWIKVHFMSPGMFGFDDVDDLVKQTRVKYLDNSDIESLGFEKPKYIVSRSVPYYKDNETRLTHIPNEGYEIATRMKGPKGSDRNKAPWHIKIYCMDIKNKSELKKILTQIGI